MSVDLDITTTSATLTAQQRAEYGKALLRELEGTPKEVWDHRKICDYIDSGADLTMPGKHNMTALHFACWKGNDALAEKLVKAGAPLNPREQDLWTPLYCAAISGNKKLVEILMAAGADETLPDKNGVTPHDIAFKNGFPDFAAAINAFTEKRNNGWKISQDRLTIAHINTDTALKLRVTQVFNMKSKLYFMHTESLRAAGTAVSAPCDMRTLPQEALDEAVGAFLEKGGDPALTDGLLQHAKPRIGKRLTV